MQCICQVIFFSAVQLQRNSALQCILVQVQHSAGGGYFWSKNGLGARVRKVHHQDEADAEAAEKSDSTKKSGFRQKFGLISCINHKLKELQSFGLLYFILMSIVSYSYNFHKNKCFLKMH